MNEISQKNKIEIIKSKLSIFDVLHHFGVDTDGESTQQIKCPFHGNDQHRSARIYEDSNTFHCFACEPPNNHLDVLNFVKVAAELSNFNEVVEYIRKNFNVSFTEKNDDVPNTIPAWKIFYELEDYLVKLNLSFEKISPLYKELDFWFDSLESPNLDENIAKQIKIDFLNKARNLISTRKRL